MPFYGLLVILVLSPLPFGSNRPWSWSLLSLLIGLVVISWCISLIFAQRKMKFHFDKVKLPLLLFLTTLAWAAIQTTAYIPESWAHPLWQMTAQVLDMEIPARISLDPEQTITAMMRLTGYGMIFLLAMYYCQKTDNVEKLFRWLAISGFIYASYGLTIHFGGFNTILWFDKWAYQHDVTSTIVNRNSYATYAGLSLLCLIPGLLSQIKSSTRYGLNSNHGKQVFIEKLITRTWCPVLMMFTVGTALFLSHSRGGFLSTTLAIISLLVVLGLSNKLRNRTLNYSAIALVFFALTLFSVSGDRVMQRMEDISIEKSGRPKVYQATWNGIMNNPILGFGYGSYENSFRLYNTREIGTYYDKAHNTYLENIFELGFPAALALFLSILLIALKCLTGVWNRQRNWIYPAIGFSSTVLVAAHSVVDFSLQIPAVAVTYAAILGAGFAQSFSTRK